MEKIIALALGGMLFLTGCGKEAQMIDQGGIEPTKLIVDVVDEYDYDWGGEIVQFEDGKVHVMSGDVIDIFEVSDEDYKTFYLGENVNLRKAEDGIYKMERVLVEDFETYHTNMGHIINEVSGEVTKVSKDKIIVGSKDEQMTFNTYREQDLAEGTKVTVAYLEYEKGEKNVVEIYNEDSKLELTVEKINRADNGLMMLDMKDAKGMEYSVPVEGRVKFNISELKVKDTLIVYPNAIMESYPMQLDVQKMELK